MLSAPDNAVNGVPSCASRELLTDTLRGRWGFGGYVSSDCGAVVGIQQGHHFTNSSAATVAAALRAGVDIDCGAFIRDHLPAALAAGSVTAADVDLALARLLSVQLRLGLYDAPASPYRRIPPSAVHSAAHLQLAREAAQQATVLLKNAGRALPLARGVRVAVR